MSELHHVAACIVAGRESEARDLLASTGTRTRINQMWPRSLLKLDKHLLIAARTTLAHVACLLGSCSSLQLVLAGGATLSQADENGDLPLHSACRSDVDCLAKVMLLVECDAGSVSSAGWLRKTPLLIAAERGNDDVTRYLLQLGVDATSRDDMSCSAAHLAAQGNHVDVILVLRGSAVDVNARDVNGQTALHTAVFYGSQGALRSLLDHPHCDVNARNTLGNTALHDAVGRASFPMVQALLTSESCDLKAKNSLQQTALQVSVKAKRRDVTKHHIEAGGESQLIASYQISALIQLSNINKETPSGETRRAAITATLLLLAESAQELAQNEASERGSTLSGKTHVSRRQQVHAESLLSESKALLEKVMQLASGAGVSAL